MSNITNTMPRVQHGHAYHKPNRINVRGYPKIRFVECGSRGEPHLKTIGHGLVIAPSRCLAKLYPSGEIGDHGNGLFLDAETRVRNGDMITLYDGYVVPPHYTLDDEHRVPTHILGSVRGMAFQIHGYSDAVVATERRAGGASFCNSSRGLEHLDVVPNCCLYIKSSGVCEVPYAVHPQARPLATRLNSFATTAIEADTKETGCAHHLMPLVVLMAIRDIEAGDELVFKYHVTLGQQSLPCSSAE